MESDCHRPLTRGLLVAVEGIDGSGKTTHSRLLKESLTKMGFDVILLREPTDSEFGRRIRELSGISDRISAGHLFELFLHDREYDVEQHILPALDAKKIVIMDRYYMSSVAYQGAAGLTTESIREANEKFAPKPDLIFILDIDPEIALRRITNRTAISPYFERQHYLAEVRKVFSREYEGRPEVRFIEASRTIGEVSAEILESVLDEIRKKGLMVCHKDRARA